MIKRTESPIVALLAALAIGLLAAAYFLFYAPTLEDRAEALEAAETLRITNDKARAELAALAEQAANMDALRAELAAETARFPTDEQLADFTRYLNALAEAEGVQLTKATRQAPVEISLVNSLPDGPDGFKPPEIPTPPTGLFEHGFELELVGAWDNALGYVERLQAQDARIFLVADLSVQAAADTLSGGLTDASDTTKFVVKGRTYSLTPTALSTEQDNA
ncbi:MAG: hypothetical protein LBD97_04860 [Bifidobacteriaceae bacterium]|jgi:hypothetical protein|nr:hypothetical protein [Bifidobacteriaceae bacterium]